MSETDSLTLERLLRTAVQVALMSYEADEDLNSGMAEDHAVERVQTLLTPAARLSLIADLASGLPRPAEDAPSPALELGCSDEAYAFILSLKDRGYYVDAEGTDQARPYVCVCINGLWVGASKPKGEVSR